MKGDFIMKEEKMVWETPTLEELTLNKTEGGPIGTLESTTSGTMS